ncbi:MAG: pilus assembly protein PilM [Gammaproteobacteria bacterium]|nr:pilus assembly protein PilM [Gammaproteobacteria bacterium]
MAHFLSSLLEKLGLSTGRRKSDLQTGVSIKRGGIAIAQIQRKADSPPQLLTCLFTPADTEEEQQQKLIELSDAHDFNDGRCCSLFASENFSLLMVEAPAVDPTELRAAIRWQIKDLIDFHIDDAVIDVFDIPEQENRGRQKMMYVVVSRISTTQAHIDRFEKHDINLDVIDIPELAQRNIAALLPEDSNGVALLSIGQHSSLVTISRNKNLYLTRHIDVGLQRIVQLIAEHKRQDELSLEDDNGLPFEVQGLLDAITLELQRSLDYYESNFSMPPVSGVIIAPMEESVPGIIPYFSSTLGTAVRMLDLNVFLDIEGTMSDKLQAQCIDAIGLALREESVSL